MRIARLSTVVLTVSGWLTPLAAHGFEHQWSLGVGPSLLAYSGDSGALMPGLSLHLVYGLSDTFDVRLQLAEATVLGSDVPRRSLGYAESLLAYKLDVLEWIPWAALGLGGFQASGGAQGRERDSIQPAVGLWFGLDYALNRQWGMGACVGLHSWAADSTRVSPRYAATNYGLHVERRFGW
jgi:hypothetical protein